MLWVARQLLYGTILSQILPWDGFVRFQESWRQGRLLGLCDRTPGVTQPSLPRACFKCPLQGFLVHPPIYEVPMHAISVSVARCVYPIMMIRKRLRVEYEFHENREYGYRMRLGTDAFVIVSNLRICHLQSSVSCHVILAILRRLTWLLWSVLSRFLPSQHEGKNTCDLNFSQDCRGRCLVSFEDPSSIKHICEMAR